MKMESRKEAEQKLQNMTSSFIEKMTPMLFAPVSMQQFVTAKDSQAKGAMWVSRTTFYKSEDQHGLKSDIVQALNDLAPRTCRYDDFSIEDVNVQWTSYKPSGKEKEPEPSISEQEKYNGMMKDLISETVVLYAHGGFY